MTLNSMNLICFRVVTIRSKMQSTKEQSDISVPQDTYEEYKN